MAWMSIQRKVLCLLQIMLDFFTCEYPSAYHDAVSWTEKQKRQHRVLYWICNP